MYKVQTVHVLTRKADMPELDDSKLAGMGEALGTETQVETPQVQPEITKVKVGDHEYTNDELSELVGLGSRAKEIGVSHGGFDNFVSEYGRTKNNIGELKKQIEDLQKQQTTGVITQTGEDQLEQAREAARKLGLVLKDDLENFSQEYYTNRRAGEKLLESCQELETEIDGADGRPKFEIQKVLEFMKENPGFKDPKRAYEAMNLDQIAEWKVEHIRKSKGKGISTITDTQSHKQPSEVRPNNSNLLDLVSEAMNS